MFHNGAEPVCTLSNEIRQLLTPIRFFSAWLSCKRVGLFNNNKAISIDTHYTSVCTLKRTQRRTEGGPACVVTLGLYAISLPVGMISETGSLAALYNAIIPHAN